MMNAGYISLLLAVIALILFASGWKDVLLRGITPTSLLLFFASWAVLLRVEVGWGGLRISGSAFVFLLLFVYVLSRARGVLLRLHLASVSLLLGALYFFMTEMLHLMPSLIVWNVPLTISLLIGLLGAMLLRSPALQLAAVAGGLLIGEGLALYTHRSEGPAMLGTAALVDLWWLSAFIVRGGALMLETVVGGLRRALRVLNETLRKESD
ncbi:YphA family membrane protein [Paenibacillus puerhi]|uniref:YphA family membrane protein n=1 Tax=Paenibacillus puerhi TaxID=2692622 RepID=UPI00135BE32F|nr:hypothetical protein [Paenibacillus puerhi]